MFCYINICKIKAFGVQVMLDNNRSRRQMGVGSKHAYEHSSISIFYEIVMHLPSGPIVTFTLRYHLLKRVD